MDGSWSALRGEDVEGLKEAIRVLDDVWQFDAARGKVDGIYGGEYRRRSPAMPLRRLLHSLGREEEALELLPEHGGTFKAEDLFGPA